MLRVTAGPATGRSLELVTPVVIGRAVHLHPVVTIFAVLVGLSTFGVLGGLLGVPVAAP